MSQRNKVEKTRLSPVVVMELDPSPGRLYRLFKNPVLNWSISGTQSYKECTLSWSPRRGSCEVRRQEGMGSPPHHGGGQPFDLRVRQCGNYAQNGWRRRLPFLLHEMQLLLPTPLAGHP